MVIICQVGTILAAMTLSRPACTRAESSIDAYEALGAFLDRTTDQAQSLNETDRKIIEFWMEAGEVDDDTKCTLSYIVGLMQQIELHMESSRMQNIQELYYYAELDVLSSCGDRVAGKELELRSFMGDDMDLLEIVGIEFNKWQHRTQDPEESFEYMTEWMLQVVGVEKKNDLRRFVDAWRRGPCTKLLARLREPDMEQLEKFVMMIDKTKYNPTKLVSDVSGLHIAVIQCCEHLQEEDVLTEVWKKLQQHDPYVRLQVGLEAIIGDYEIADSDDSDYSEKDTPESDAAAYSPRPHW